MDADPDGAADAKDVVKRNRLRGMKIRDEFICPITYELLREPMVAPDGHTYEKNAIEKWMKTHTTSPRSGEPMPVMALIPNHNLRKLIQDLIDEGGAGFYTKDISNKDRLFDVRPEKMLLLECLGPPESDWNQQSFQVTNLGCLGGRKIQTETEGFESREPMLFRDVTVSRKHFEIFPRNYADGTQEFYVRDLGSAGGTFIRVAFGIRKQLNPGMIILLGKHQFTVASIDDGPTTSRSSRDNSSFNNINAADGPHAAGPKSARRSSAVNSDQILSTVKEINHIAADLQQQQQQQQQSLQAKSAATEEERRQELSNRLRHLTMALSSQLDEENHGNAALDPNNDVDNNNNNNNNDNNNNSNAFKLGNLGPSSATINTSGSGADYKNTAVVEEDAGDKHGGVYDGINTGDEKDRTYSNRRCTLTCCAPDGSPLQGQSYTVTSAGAGLGRKATNAIPLIAHMNDPTTGEVKQVNVDTAISSEHARIEFDNSSGHFFIVDGGSVGKASTNGTWYRLSGPYQESPPHLLEGNMEFLIGTVRFIVRESMTIAEHGVSDSTGTPSAAPHK